MLTLPPVTGASTTTTTLFSQVLQEWLASRPESIANDISRWGSISITAQEVESLARQLCERSYDPRIVENVLQTRRATQSALLIRPLNRLATRASNGCTVPATDQQTARYGAAMISYAFAVDTNTAALGAAPDAVQSQICGILGSPRAGDVIAGVAEELLALASRGRVQGGVFLSIAAEVAASSCNFWLPRAEQVLSRVANS